MAAGVSGTDLTYFWAIIEYDGTDYHGFQVQADQSSIQGVLEQALNRLTQQKVRVRGAGRTDAGVHARGQVIAFRAHWRHSTADLHRAMNAVLPPDIALLSLEVASDDFHPRYSAKSRWYRYTVLNQPLRSPLSQRWALNISKSLEMDLMNQAAAALIGEQDFATFGRPPQGENTIRRVLRAHWWSEKSFLYFDIEATAFLQSMVRSLVGTLIQVGLGEFSPQEFSRRLAACDRALAGPTAPPQGLCLMAVNY